MASVLDSKQGRKANQVSLARPASETTRLARRAKKVSYKPVQAGETESQAVRSAQKPLGTQAWAP